jgi:hypothetical protein
MLDPPPPDSPNQSLKDEIVHTVLSTLETERIDRENRRRDIEAGDRQIAADRKEAQREDQGARQCALIVAMVVALIVLAVIVGSADDARRRNKH